MRDARSRGRCRSKVHGNIGTALPLGLPTLCGGCNCDVVHGAPFNGSLAVSLTGTTMSKRRLNTSSRASLLTMDYSDASCVNRRIKARTMRARSACLELSGTVTSFLSCLSRGINGKGCLIFLDTSRKTVGGTQFLRSHHVPTND